MESVHFQLFTSISKFVTVCPHHLQWLSFIRPPTLHA